MITKVITVVCVLLFTHPAVGNSWFSLGKSGVLKNSQNIYNKKPVNWFTSHAVWGKNGGEAFNIITGKVISIPWYGGFSGYPGNVLLKNWSGFKLVSFDGGLMKGWYFGNIKNQDGIFYLVEIDYRAKKVNWSVKIPGNDLVSVGMDNVREFFVTASRTSPGNKAGQTIIEKIIRIDVKKRKIDRIINFNVKTRNSQKLSNLVYFPSADFKYIYVREHDEYNSKTGKGFLKLPEAQGFIINIQGKTHFTFKTPVEVWTAAFTSDNSYCYISSYQKGTLNRLNIKSKSVDKVIKTAERNILLSVTKSVSLYALHLNGLKIYDKNFKLMQSFSRKEIINNDVLAGPYDTDSTGTRMILGLLRNGQKTYQILNLLR